MIFKGSKVTLRPNRTYKDDPSKNVDIDVGTDTFGDYLQMQVLDINNIAGNNKCGFFYVRVHTDLALAVGDTVTIKDFLYIQRKGNICVFAITIEEHSPFGDDLIEESNGGVEF